MVCSSHQSTLVTYLTLAQTFTPWGASAPLPPHPGKFVAVCTCGDMQKSLIVPSEVVTSCVDAPAEESPAAAFPLAAYTPYDQPGFVWNPPGSGLALDEFAFPIMLLDHTTAPAAVERAAYNAQQVRLMPDDRHTCCLPV